MPYAWTGRTDLSYDGYNHREYDGPADNYCYIGFQDHSPYMLDDNPNLQIVRGEMSGFVETFYDYATGQVDGINHPIWLCLEYASMWTFDNDFQYSSLYPTHGWWWDDTDYHDGLLRAGGSTI